MALECILVPAYSTGCYKYAIILARENRKFLWCRQKGKTTWEMPGGHVEPGETPEQAARRELFEETGAVGYTLRPLFDCCAGGDAAVVYLAEVTERAALPESEMAEVRPGDTIPGEWSWPLIQPKILQHYRELFEREKPEFLYHGSPERVERLEPRTACGLPEESGTETGVYAYASPEACVPFALRYLPDEKGNLSIRIDDRTHQVTVSAGMVDWNWDGWIYRLPPDSFVRLDEMQWISREPVAPLEAVPVRAEDCREMVEESHAGNES